MGGYVVGPAVVCVAVAVVISVVINVHGRWKKVREGRLLYNLVPRFFLLRAFYEILPKLPSLYVGAEWENVCYRIKKDLGEIERAVGQDAISEESDERKIDPRVRTKCVAEAIDKHLVPFLQSQTQLAGLLDGYLPDFQQSWRDLLNRELDETEKKLVGLNKPACPGEQLDAVKACGMLVASFIQDLGEINLTIEAATRGSLRIADAYIKKQPTMYKEVKVFYATDRHVTEDGEYIGQRTLSRDGGLHYGYMVVGIPDCHKPGYVESPLANEEADPLKHVVILSINTKMRADKGRFLIILNDELQKEEYQPVGEVLLFIHGYNVQHKDAIMRAAQVKFDLKFKGVAIAYSWSSKGTLWGYDHDQVEVQNTVPSLQSFIKSILSEVPHVTKVHILAHSMGNRALIQALRNLQQEQLFTRHATLKNVIFAAADEERKRFDELVHDLHQRNPQSKCPRFTVYSSKDDWALFTSKFLHGHRSRLGDTLSLFETDSNDCSTDVVDASGTDASSWLCHSYYGRVPDVLKDMHLLLVDCSAKDRSSCEDPLIRAVTFRERDFYAFRQTIWGVAVASGTMEGYFSRADATLKAVQATVDGDPLMPNNLQCKLLVGMLQEARDAVIKRFPDMLTRPNSTISHPNGGLLVREFYRIVKHVESLIVKSAEKPWFVAAIVIGDCKEEFRLRISEIARLIAIVQEKEDPDRRRWLERIDEIVKSKECDWKERISSAALMDEATFRVTRLPSSTRNSEFSKGSPEDHAARYLLQDDDDGHKIGLGAIEEDTEKDESGSWKDKFFRVSGSDLEVFAGSIARETRKAMWMGKEFALKRTYPDSWQWATIHSTCAHPNIVRFIGLVPKETDASYSPSFLEEWMDLDLRALLPSSHSSKETISKFPRPPFDIFGALDIMLQIAQAMKYLHDRDVVHLDVRPDNILVNVLSGASIPVQERIVLAKVSIFVFSEKINSDPKGTGLFRKEDDVCAYGEMCVKLLRGEDVTYSTRRSTIIPDSCPPPLQKLMHSCLDGRLTFNNICVDLIHLKSVLMIDGNMQALDPIKADEFAPGLRSGRIEPDHQNQVDKTEANGHWFLLIILLILCMGLWLGAIKCWTLPIFSFLMNVISVSIGLYLLDFHEPVIWKYRTWRFLKVVLGLKKTMEVANFLRESIPALAPCNYVVDVGRYETNVRTFMARSSPIPVHQQKISPVPLHSGRRPLKSKIGSVEVSDDELPHDSGQPPLKRTSRSEIGSVEVSDDELPLDSVHPPLKRISRSEIGSVEVPDDELPLDSVHPPLKRISRSEIGSVEVSDDELPLDSVHPPLKRISRSEIGSVEVPDDELPLDSGHPLLHVRFEIGSARVSVVELRFDNVHFTSKVGGRKIEDFVVAMDLERLGTILAILHRWELSPGIGVIENMIYRPGGIYCHCLSLQSIVEGVCESINHFSDFYLPISKTFYVGCIPENQRGLYRNHVVIVLVAVIISTVSTFFQLWKDYPIVAIVLTVVLLVFVLGANVLDIFGGLALPILWYLILYVLCCGGHRRSRFYLWLKKCGSSMAFCDDFKPVIHYARPGRIEMMTLPFCSLRDPSIPSGGPPLDWPAIDVFLYKLPGQRIQRLELADFTVVELLQGERRIFLLNVGDRLVEARSNYVGHSGLLQTQLRLDARGMFHTYSWAEDSYFLFVYLMLKWSKPNDGVIKTVQRFSFKDFYHVFGTHELAEHIANHNLVDYNIVAMTLDHTAMVL